MTEPTINLQKDCELWVDFDTRYWDAQRNQIQDRSGHGRHPEAFGGPTVGVNGPDNFEAASFDGSDDYFIDVGDVDIPDGEDWSVFTLVKVRNTSRHNYIVSAGNAMSFELDTLNDEMEWLDEDFNNHSVSVPVFTDEWRVFGLIHDGGSYRFSSIGKAQGYVSAVGSTRLNLNEIAARTDAGFYANADFSWLGVWNRVLSDAEIQHLNRLTAPRRGLL